MKKLFVFLGIALSAIGSAVSAQEVDSMADYIPEISLDMRGSYRLGSGYGAGRFSGDDLNIDINGYISPQFSYSFNHRIASSYYGEASGFDATNWLTLTYETGDFAFTAGKDALLMGSFEYDAYDLDAYCEMNSAFYNMFDCWQWGATAAWYPAENHEILFQFANSPYADGEPALFSYAAGWRGAWDIYESYWTVNMWQTAPGEYIKSINLGNRFHLGGFTIDLDLCSRADAFDGLLNDVSLMCSPAYEFGEWGRAFIKAGWERMENEDYYGYAGDNIIYGGGFEYFPLKENKDIRLHAVYTHNDYMTGDLFSIGLTWKMKLKTYINLMKK
jgi:hypothetical protein